ncbi:DNA-directed RNA polymerase subunit [Mycobacterium phage prophiGD05-3]|nr:DNA-directed RNA polymerase subunit [Mycobacterium phage prophiGD05-3]
MSNGGVRLICQRCSREFGTDRIRDLCHGCQLAQQAVWPSATHQRLGDVSGA